jgi:catechol 2,3-dioxygenase-like lactoylglutathione lyase family enzyme
MKQRTTIALSTVIVIFMLSMAACVSRSQTPATQPSTNMGMETPSVPTDGTGSLQVGQLDHVILRVSNLDTESAFYTKMLGWKQIAQTPNNNLGLVGGIGLNLVKHDEPPATTIHAGVDVLGFKTTDINKAIASLKAANLKFTQSDFPLPDGNINLVLTFADPEGNTINLVQPKQ